MDSVGRGRLLAHGGEGATVPVLDLASRPATHAHLFKVCMVCGQDGPVGQLCRLAEECPLALLETTKGVCLNCLALIKRGLPYAPDADVELGGL